VRYRSSVKESISSAAFSFSGYRRRPFWFDVEKKELEFCSGVQEPDIFLQVKYKLGAFSICF